MRSHTDACQWEMVDSKGCGKRDMLNVERGRSNDYMAARTLHMQYLPRMLSCAQASERIRLDPQSRNAYRVQPFRLSPRMAFIVWREYCSVGPQVGLEDLLSVRCGWN